MSKLTEADVEVMLRAVPKICRLCQLGGKEAEE